MSSAAAPEKSLDYSKPRSPRRETALPRRRRNSQRHRSAESPGRRGWGPKELQSKLQYACMSGHARTLPQALFSCHADANKCPQRLHRKRASTTQSREVLAERRLFHEEGVIVRGTGQLNPQLRVGPNSEELSADGAVCCSKARKL